MFTSAVLIFSAWNRNGLSFSRVRSASVTSWGLISSCSWDDCFCTAGNGKGYLVFCLTHLELDLKFLHQFISRGECEDLSFCQLNHWRRIFRWPHRGTSPFWELTQDFGHCFPPSLPLLLVFRQVLQSRMTLNPDFFSPPPKFWVTGVYPHAWLCLLALPTLHVLLLSDDLC